MTPPGKTGPAALLPLEAIRPGEAKGVELAHDNEKLNLIVWHQGSGIRVFGNACPHLGLPLETFPDRFLTADKKHLICSAHAATFNMEGLCIAGPCPGKRLREHRTIQLDGWLMLG